MIAFGSNFSGDGCGVIKIYSHAVFAVTLCLPWKGLEKTPRNVKREQLPNCDRKSTVQMLFFNVLFTKIYIYFLQCFLMALSPNQPALSSHHHFQLH